MQYGCDVQSNLKCKFCSVSSWRRVNTVGESSSWSTNSRTTRLHWHSRLSHLKWMMWWNCEMDFELVHLKFIALRMIVHIAVDNILISYYGAVSSINFHTLIVLFIWIVAKVIVLCPFADIQEKLPCQDEKYDKIGNFL